ncbi:prolyl oligopeptidase family serine peptidase [Krasilnikovia sp. M28-CT-15]|uniref:S9 family peptidase n=1 Tax=Krasilnikovia sp. M28-CT-15 TaxID=3373540 RepID=UPI00399D4A58
MSSYRDFRPTLRFQAMLAVSPDGRQVAFADDAAGQFNLTIQATAGGPSRRITDFRDHTVRRCSWRPDGASLVFEADHKGDFLTQLYLIAPGDEEPQALTETAGATFCLPEGGGAFSPDGHYLAYEGNDRDLAEQDIVIRTMKTGEVRRVYTGGGRMTLGGWSPDGSRLNFTLGTGGYDHVLHVVSVKDGEVRRLTASEGASVYLGPWLPDGSGIVVRTDAGREFKGLAVVDAADGHLTWLDTPDWDVEAVALSANGKVLVWMVNVDGATELRARDLTTNDDLPMPALPLGQADALAVSADGGFAVMRMSTPARPWNIAVVDLASGALRWLTDSRPEVADSTSFVEPTLVHYETFDGRTIPAYLYRPTNVIEPVGVLLSVHGGPTYQERPVYMYDGFYQYLASKGIAVLAPNVRGSTGYGKPYQRLVYRDWGGDDLKDFAHAARYLQGQDWVDATRIGLFGASYGGFVVLSCLARLPEFDWAAGVSMFGPSNLVTLAEATPKAYRSLVAEVIGDPDTEAERMLARSPITYADQIRSPLFVWQGAKDTRVPQQESDQLVERLRDRGVEVRYDVYPDEGHGLTKTENQIQARSDVAEFLITHLRN